MKFPKLRAKKRKSTTLPLKDQDKSRPASSTHSHSKDSDLREAALAYAATGVPVVPAHSATDGVCSCRDAADCSRPGKHPRTKNGIKDATTDPEQIKEWWERYPDANIGLVMGKEARLFCIDVDARDGGLETLKKLKEELGDLPRTPRAETGGGGRHYWFQYPDFDLKTDHGKLFGPGIDVQSDGSMIVAPPSCHASGLRYQWFKDRAPSTCRVRTLPPAWLAMLQAAATADKPPRKTVARPDPAKIPPGSRNNHLMQLAGKLHNTGLSHDALLQALLIQNDLAFDPPLDRNEVEKVAESVSRYAVHSTPDQDKAELIMQLVLDRHFAGGEHLIYAPDGQFWSFHGTHWKPLPIRSVEQIALEETQAMPKVGGHNTSSLMKQATALLSAKQAINDDRFGFHSAPLPIINCQNGELWIRPDGKVKLKPHRFDSYQRSCLDVPYDPQAKCPEFDKALEAIFSNSPDTEDLVRHWHELTGYISQPQRPIANVAIGQGSGANGKTALLQTISRLLGPELMVAMKIEDLNGNRFVIASLFGKRLLLDDDVRKGIRLPDGELKKLSEAKMVTGERKFGPTFNFVLQATPFLLCNDPPSLMDISPGMLRRLMVIPFRRSFSEAEDDRTLFPRIWQNELPGILNHAVAGLRRVVRRGWRFQPPASVMQAKQEWITSANPLPAFLDDCCNRDGTCWVQDLYETYTDWAKRMGITIVQQQQTFRRNLENLGFAVKHGNRGNKVIGLSKK